MAVFAESQGVPASAIIEEGQAHDTNQNIFYSAQIMHMTDHSVLGRNRQLPQPPPPRSPNRQRLRHPAYPHSPLTGTPIPRIGHPNSTLPTNTSSTKAKPSAAFVSASTATHHQNSCRCPRLQLCRPQPQRISNHRYRTISHRRISNHRTQQPPKHRIQHTRRQLALPEALYTNAKTNSADPYSAIIPLTQSSRPQNPP